MADYVNFQQIMDAMPDATWNSSYEVILRALATRASRLIDAHLKREPGAFAVAADTTRYFTGDGCDELWIGELAAAPTSLAVAEAGILTAYTTWAATDYLLWPYNAIAEGKPYTRLDIDHWNGTKSSWYSYPKAVKIVGKFGFSTVVPDEIVEAAIIQAVRWFKRGQQAFQDTGAITQLAQLQYVKRLDPDVELILSAPKFQVVTI